MTERKSLSKDNIDLSSLYRHGATDEPPTHLDQAIIALAQEHSVSDSPLDETGDDSLKNDHPPKNQATVSFLRRWQWPVSMAAVVVVSSSIVLDLHQRQKLDVEFESVAPERFDGVPQDQLEPLMDSDFGDSYSAGSTLMQSKALKSKALDSETREGETQEIETPDEAFPAQAPSAPVKPMAVPLKEEARMFEEQQLGKQKLEEQTLEALDIESKGVEMETELTKERSQLRRAKKERAETGVLSKDVWLQRIDQLIEQGEWIEARRELQSLLKAYPDSTLIERHQKLLDSEEKNHR